MDDYHKVRLFNDFPILLDYLKDIKKKRLHHSFETKCKKPTYPKEYERNYHRLNKYSLKISSISFTRKIIDIQKDPNDDFQQYSKTNEYFGNNSPFDLTNHLIVDQHKRITSNCKNKSHLFKLDGSLYLVDQLNQTIIDKSNLLICKRIDNDNSTMIQKHSSLNFNNSGEDHCQKKACDSLDTKIIHQTIEKNRSNIKMFEDDAPRMYRCSLTLFSDLIAEEEYKQLPISSSRNQPIFNRKQQIENNSIIRDNENEKTTTTADVQPINNIKNSSKGSNYNEIINRNISNQNELVGKNMRDEILTIPNLSIPNWKELCERVYRLKPTRTTNDNSAIIPVCPIIDNYYFLPNELWDNFPLHISSNDSSAHNRNLFEDINFNSSNKNHNNLVDNLDIKSLYLENGTIESIENFDLKSFICQQAKRIFSLRKEILDKNDNHKSLENWIEQLPYGNDHFPMTPYRLFLFDLCKETIMEMFPTDIDPSKNIELTLMLPLKMQKQPWPLDSEQFAQLVLDSVKKTLDVSDTLSSKKQDLNQSISNINGSIDLCDNKKNSANIKRFGLMAFCRMQRKLDFVDRVLYQEMLGDQARWSYFEPEMLEIKHLICDMILEELIFGIIKSLEI